MIRSLFKSRLREHPTKERMNNGAKSSGQYSRAAKTVHLILTKANGSLVGKKMGFRRITHTRAEDRLRGQSEDGRRQKPQETAALEND